MTRQQAQTALLQVGHGIAVLAEQDIHLLCKVRLADPDTGRPVLASAALEGYARSVNRLAFRARRHEQAVGINGNNSRE